jgi:hypothetical protein
MIFGDVNGHQTLPISIYSDYTSGRSLDATSPTWLAVVALSCISLGIVLIYNRTTSADRD